MQRGARTSLLVFPLLLLAGCSSAPGGTSPSGGDEPFEAAGPTWAPLPCDPSGATSVGRNAPAPEGLRAPWATVAARVAQAFGDALTSPTPREATEDFARWDTSTGHVQVSRSQEKDSWDLATWRGGFPSEEHLRSALQELGVPASSLRTEHHSPGHFRQVWVGHVLHDPLASFLQGRGDPAPVGLYGSFHLRSLVVPPGPLEGRSEASLASTAQAYDRCALQAEGATEYAQMTPRVTLGSYAVQHDSLVRLVNLQYSESDAESHCGFGRVVAVDFVTGAVHGARPPTCG